jgi:hypothetical protein
MTNPTPTAEKSAPVEFNEDNPRFFSENGEIFDKIHGGNLPIAEIVWLLNNAEFTIAAYKSFEGKMRWALKALPSQGKKRGFEG